MVLTQDMRDFDRSFFIVDALICMVAIAGSRFAERTLVIGTQLGARPDGQAHADRRRRPHRPQPDARAARDRRRAGRRLRRRQPAPPPAQRPGVKVARHDLRAGARARAHRARHRPRHDPGRAARDPRRASSRPAPRPASRAASSGARSTSTRASCSALRQNDPAVTLGLRQHHRPRAAADARRPRCSPCSRRS